ncbi:MAG: hypothetical protein TEF_14395 [Rhizobiales bacterium NRL2]|nr:MAG: hypothetical protein TEF_14395 [Rhizobiales bacterium NRL2]
MAASVLAGLQAAQAAGGMDQAVSALASAPQTETLYKSDGQALYRGNGGGKQWTKVPLAAQPDGGRVAAVAVSVGEQSQLYVAGIGLGVLKSVDAGKSWSHVDQGLPGRDVVAFAAHSTAPDTLFAVVAGEGVYRSEDGGAQWRMVDKGPEADIRRLIHSNLEGSMQSGWLFAATDKGVYRSMDCFCGWRPAGSLPGSVSAVAYDPKQPMELYAATGREVFRTVDGGEEWQAVGSPGAQVNALAYSPSGVLHALLSDGRVVQSRDKGKQWE